MAHTGSKTDLYSREPNSTDTCGDSFSLSSLIEKYITSICLLTKLLTKKEFIKKHYFVFHKDNRYK